MRPAKCFWWHPAFILFKQNVRVPVLLGQNLNKVAIGNSNGFEELDTVYADTEDGGYLVATYPKKRCEQALLLMKNHRRQAIVCQGNKPTPVLHFSQNEPYSITKGTHTERWFTQDELVLVNEGDFTIERGGKTLHFNFDGKKIRGASGKTPKFKTNRMLSGKLPPLLWG